jgi:hypothetical protein
MEELQHYLEALPADLGTAGQQLAESAADQCAQRIRDAYPEGKTGNLKKGVLVREVTLSYNGQPMGARCWVVNTAPHAHLFEYGTQVRHTDLNWNRGKMPAHPTFIPLREQYQRGLIEALQQLLESRGLEVSGDAG